MEPWNIFFNIVIFRILTTPDFVPPLQAFPPRGTLTTMKPALLTHWKSTVLGIVIAALGAFATTANLDSLSWKQAALAFAGCVLYAVKGVISADAKQTPPSPVAGQPETKP